MSKQGQTVAVIAGASGFIGQRLRAAFLDDGYDVRTIGRNDETSWDDTDAVRRAVDGADVLVGLAGKSVDCRYTGANRTAILSSRVDTTRALHDAVAHAAHPPRVWMNASTATIYRHEMERPNTEADGQIGTGFSVDVATSWERALFAGDLPHTRRIALRMAIVLGDGPATDRLFTIARLGLGGTQYDGWCPPHRRYAGIGEHPSGTDHAIGQRTNGRQRFSWVHIDDVISAIRFLRDADTVDGPVNIATPTASDNRTLMRTLRHVEGAPIGIPSRRWMLELAMWALRTEPELVMKSRWVAPEKLQQAGFAFAHADLEEALREIRTLTRR